MQIHRKNPKIIATRAINAIVDLNTPGDSCFRFGVYITGLSRTLGVVEIDFLKVKLASKNKRKISND